MSQSIHSRGTHDRSSLDGFPMEARTVSLIAAIVPDLVIKELAIVPEIYVRLFPMHDLLSGKAGKNNRRQTFADPGVERRFFGNADGFVF
ncbi:uncharacterized protein PV09_03664 [Verruconis gallopava]|uniref:Uncharacterized protein n=1 Tax=Verruconis gallopava TaxID=253628 RepID=A0A0D1YWN9_9PEZI|nr:uncharacterized protein PV09_03664 [Verruconis gallopava]KIW05107.1 hypothetical protein PV09_03664 [Verruconis gallopava]